MLQAHATLGFGRGGCSQGPGARLILTNGKLSGRNQPLRRSLLAYVAEARARLTRPARVFEVCLRSGFAALLPSSPSRRFAGRAARALCWVRPLRGREVARKPDAAELLTRVQGPVRGARMYLLTSGGPQGGWVDALLRLASTRGGRRTVLAALARAAAPTGVTAGKRSRASDRAKLVAPTGGSRG